MRDARPIGRPRTSRTAALAACLLSIAALALGIALAAARFPEGFDWAYTVMSALASRKHNPEGARFFAVGLALSLAALWPAVGWLDAHCDGRGKLARFGLRSLRVGIVSGVVVGVERLAFHHLSDLVPKGHEAIALVAFFGLFLGVVALYADRLRRGAGGFRAVLLVIVPLVAIGLSQLGLYLDQRDLGWVGRDWRAMGIPVWWSFAFWQWLAALGLWLSIAHLVATARAEPVKNRVPRPRVHEAG